MLCGNAQTLEKGEIHHNKLMFHFIVDNYKRYKMYKQKHAQVR